MRLSIPSITVFLVEVSQLVLAETFDDLLEEATYLDSEGHFLAAGVLGLAVLEVHLREMCDSRACMPSKARPTIDDFKTELNRNKHIDKIGMKNVESMAAIGNSNKHNKPGLRSDDVNCMLRDVRGILIRHAVLNDAISYPNKSVRF